MEHLLEYNNFGDADIVITIPKSIPWSEYEKELARAEEGEVMNYKVTHFPKTKVGCKCYVVHEDHIRGYMQISGMSEKEFTCSTTGKEWKGKFVERTGKFHKLDQPIPMKGFRGYRYFKPM